MVVSCFLQQLGHLSIQVENKVWLNIIVQIATGTQHIHVQLSGQSVCERMCPNK